MKIRVYELAKELNMTNKALLDKIKKMGDIEIRSHMSSLEPDDIEKIKARLLGKENQSEEKRVKPTVIRRRKKKKEAEQEDSETKSIDTDTDDGNVEESSEEENIPEEIIAKDEDSSTEQDNAPEEAEAEKIQEEQDIKPDYESPRQESKPEEEKPVKKEETKTKKAKKKQTSSAKIIFRPDIKPAVKKEEPKEKAPEKENKKSVKNDESDKKAAAAQTNSDNKKKDKSQKVTKKEPSKENLFDEIDVKPVPAPVINEIDEDDIKKGSKLNKGRNQAEDAKKIKKKKLKSKKKEIVEKEDLYESKGKKGKRDKRQEKKKAAFQKTQITTPKAIKRRVKIDDTIILAELAKRMGIKANEMIVKLMSLGVMATVNQTIDFETAELVASEFGFEVERAAFEEDVIINLHHEEKSAEDLVHRPPVVTVMGHVDHGKTSLLDAIRHTGVAEGEAGGITQHIGAYIVSTESGDITFLDTPGHEAFTAMRSRGAQITDIVILVVAADDGVMPQTIEAINHAKAAEVPMVVAVNKIDKPGAEPEVVKRELSEHGILSEAWGGDTIFVNVSAKEKTGIDELLEMILLQAEMLDLKADSDKLAKGHVIEAKLDSGRGAVASILIQEGTLNQGDPIVCGIHYGRIRAMFNDQGKKIQSAGPSVPVEIIGLNGVPGAGDELIALKDEKEAKQVGEHRAAKQRAKDLAKTSRMSLEGLFERIEQKNIKDLNLIIKADVQGSIEALKDALIKLSSDEVKIKIIHAATGTVSESDISLASVSDAIILGFNVRPAPKVREQAEEENIEMKFYNVIYDAIIDIQNAMLGLMDSTFKEVVMGTAEVRAVFSVPKIGKVAGCFVTHGTMKRNLNTRVLRDGVILFDGQMASLKRFKDDVREVNSGYECGIGIEKFNDIKEGDMIECYMLEEEKPTL